MSIIHDAALALRRANIPFQATKGGAHMLVKHNGLEVDFWPVSGKFFVRRHANQSPGPTQHLNGVFALISYLTGATNG